MKFVFGDGAGELNCRLGVKSGCGVRPVFDSYHKWLGIPEGHRPPTHYQLLGISPDAASKRYGRAVARLAIELRKLGITSH